MTREEAVQSLVRFDKPVDMLRECLSAFPLDWDAPALATLKAEHLLTVLSRWERGELSAEGVETWGTS